MINGRAYDAATGLPATSAAKIANNLPKGKVFSDIGPRKSVQDIAKPTAAKAATPRQTGVNHRNIHQATQKSQTLYRAALKRPETAPAKPAAPTKSPLISRFGPAQSAAKAIPAKPQEAPVQPAQPSAIAPVKPAQLLGSELKERLIKEKIAEAEANKAKRKTASKHGGRLRAFMQRRPKIASIATVTMALLILGGYITYINLPNLSVRVAAAQAGINASYPQYQPDGYSFNGPVAYAPGEVTLNFQSNSNHDQDYIIKQRASSWDSQAVLDNYVSKETGTYLTYSERGLTVYTYGSKAAWVNGGILYTLNGNAPLSSDQILKIAASM